MIKYVLDASAILALLQNENGKDTVEEVMDDAIVSRVNAAEVLTKLIENGLSLIEAKEALDTLDIAVVDYDENQALKTAELRPLSKHLGLSLGDRCCLALAILEDATAITADRVWKDFEECEVEGIR